MYSIKTLVSLLGGVLVLGGAAYVASSDSSPKTTPEEVFAAALEKTLHIETTHFKQTTALALTNLDIGAVMNFSGSKANLGKTQTPGELAITVVGDVDLKDFAHLKSSFAVTGNAHGLASTDPSYPFSIEVRQDSDMAYLRVLDLPAPLKVFAGTFLNQWISIPIDKSSLPSPLQKTLTEEQKVEMQKAIMESKVVSIVSELPGEKVGGVSTRVFILALDTDRALSLVVRLQEIVGTPLSVKDKARLAKDMEATMFGEVKIWIGARDQYPYKIVVSGSGDDPTTTAHEGNTFAHTLELGNINKPIHVEIPTDARPIEEIMGELFGGMMQNR